MFNNMTSTMGRRILVLVATGALAAAMLAACGSADSGTNEPSSVSTAPNGDVVNEADVVFAQQMIPHHAQAVQMVDMTRGRKVSPEVEQLATQIMDTQTLEIQAMTAWLTAWQEEIPETTRDHVNAHGDGDGADKDVPGADLPGMMSQEAMESLEAADDGEFEDTWLRMMIEHHEGAVEIAHTQQQDGEFSEAITMAQNIEASQTQEIEELQALLGK